MMMRSLATLAKNSSSSKLPLTTSCGGHFLGIHHMTCTKKNQGEVAAYEKDGVEYVFDFAEKVVTNVTNQRRHSIRLVWVEQGDEHAHWTGEKPPQ